MPGPSLRFAQYPANLLAQRRARRAGQKSGVQVSLNGAGADARPCFVQRLPPIHADHVAARIAKILQEARCPGSKMNRRNAGAFQLLKNISRIRMNEARVIFPGKASNPTVEQL